jgi:hypothetical protein
LDLAKRAKRKLEAAEQPSVAKRFSSGLPANREASSFQVSFFGRPDFLFEDRPFGQSRMAG